VKVEIVSAPSLHKYLRKPAILFFIFFAFLVLFLFVRMFLSGYIIGSDALGYYAHLRSILIDGDLQYANEFLDYNPFGHAVPNPYRLTVTDHTPNPYYIGPASLWAPFFLVAHAFASASDLFGLDLTPDGYSALYQILIGLGSVVYGMAGLALIYKILMLFFQRNEALLATGLIALGTNVFYYLTIEPTMSHAMSMFAVTLFAFVWVKSIDQRNKNTVILLGFTAGLMILIRPQNVLFLSILGLEWVGLFKTESGFFAHWRKKIVEAGFFGLVLLTTLLPQLIVWKILYGQFLIQAYEGASFEFTDPYLWKSLFSARHGLISWTPIILLALAGALLFLRKYPRLGIALLIAFMLQWYINASWTDYWWFGESFGSRTYINCSFIFAIGLATLLSSTKRIAVIMYPLLAALIIWNLLFIAQYSMGMLSRSEAVDFRQVLSNQFAIPEIIYRSIEERL